MEDDAGQVCLQLFQCSCKLVRAAGATTLTVNAFQHADDILDFAAFAKSGDTFGVAVAAFDNCHTANDIAFGLEVNLCGAG